MLRDEEKNAIFQLSELQQLKECNKKLLRQPEAREYANANSMSNKRET